MKIKDAYRLAVEAGMESDPRPKDEVQKLLQDSREEFEKLPADKRKYFDRERLWNPYSDTRFSWGNGDAEAETFLWGIDVGTGEVLLADRLREKGMPISAVVAHHPTGLARTQFPEVMWMQAEMYHGCGVPINVAEALIKPRMEEVLRNVMGSNYNQAVDAAKLLNIPLFNLHSAADNMVQRYLTDLMDQEQPRYLEDIVDALMKEPEYQVASKENNPPKILVGTSKSRCGRAVCKMTGGTSGPLGLYEKLADAGVGTVVGMHFPESHVEEAKKQHVNLVVSGHMASDSLGINLISDIWEREGVDVLACSGLIRVSRN